MLLLSGVVVDGDYIIFAEDIRQENPEGKKTFDSHPKYNLIIFDQSHQK